MASSVPIRYRQAIRNSPASPWSVSRAHQKHCPLRTPSADGSPRGRGTADRAALHLGALVHARTASGAVMASSVPIRYSQIRNGPASPWSISDRPHRRMCASSRLAGPIPVRRLKNCVNRSSSSAPEGVPSAVRQATARRSSRIFRASNRPGSQSLSRLKRLQRVGRNSSLFLTMSRFPIAIAIPINGWPGTAWMALTVTQPVRARNTGPLIGQLSCPRAESTPFWKNCSDRAHP